MQEAPFKLYGVKMNQQKVNEIIAASAYVNVSGIVPSQSLAYDLYMDSFMLTDMMCSLEDEFMIKIEEEDISKAEFVQDIYRVLTKKGIDLSD